MTLTKLALYESNMTEWGAIIDAAFDDPAVNDDASLLNTYYDSQYCFYQIADYTGDSAWLATANKAQAAYATYYVDAAGGNVPGYWIFTQGLAEDVLRNSDANALASLSLLDEFGSYVRDVPNTLIELQDPGLSRENSYAGICHINAMRCGLPTRSRLDTLLENALLHIDAWTTSMTAPYFRPFMGALTAKFLIHYWDYVNADARIPVNLKTLAQYTMSSCWLSGVSSWTYTDRDVGQSGDLDPQYDLNLLILPYFGWLYLRTGESNWIDIADAAFDAGVSVYDGEGFHQSGAWFGSKTTTGVSGKQFNQNYVWSMKYLEYRAGTPDSQALNDSQIATNRLTPTPSSRGSVSGNFDNWSYLVR